MPVWARASADTFGDIADMRRRAAGRMHQTRTGTDANVRRPAKVPFISFFDLMHFRIALTTLIPGRRVRRTRYSV